MTGAPPAAYNTLIEQMANRAINLVFTFRLFATWAAVAALALTTTGEASHATTSRLLAAQQTSTGPPAGCPATLPLTTLSTRPGAALALVPEGARSLLLCSYHGLNPPAQARRLEHIRLVSAPAELAQLTGEFNALHRQPPITFHCPMDDGSEILAIFRYVDAPSDRISVGLTGCQIVSNSHLTRTASLPPGPALLDQLTSLLG